MTIISLVILDNYLLRTFDLIDKSGYNQLSRSMLGQLELKSRYIE